MTYQLLCWSLTEHLEQELDKKVFILFSQRFLNSSEQNEVLFKKCVGVGIVTVVLMT